jgi:hypothetical protein
MRTQGERQRRHARPTRGLRLLVRSLRFSDVFVSARTRPCPHFRAWFQDGKEVFQHTLHARNARAYSCPNTASRIGAMRPRSRRRCRASRRWGQSELAVRRAGTANDRPVGQQAPIPQPTDRYRLRVWRRAAFAASFARKVTLSLQ